MPPWSADEKLAFEKELLGFYVTGHPLDAYRPLLESGKYTPIPALAEMDDKAQVQVAGVLTMVEKKFTKRESKPFAIVNIEDLSGTLEVAIWNDVFNKCAAILEIGRAVTIAGRLDKREETPRISAAEVTPLKRGPRAEPLVFSLRRERVTEGDLYQLQEVIRRFPGPRDLQLDFANGEGSHVRMQLGPEYRIDPQPRLKTELAGLPILDFGF